MTPRNPYRRGMISTVDLLVLTSLDFWIEKNITKQDTLMRRSTVLTLPLQLVVPVDTKKIYFKSIFVVRQRKREREREREGEKERKPNPRIIVKTR